MASPLGFSETGRSFYNRTLIPEVIRLDFEVVDPWTLTDQAKIDAVQKMPYGEDRRDAWRRLNVEIGGNNRVGIDGADMVLAVARSPIFKSNISSGKAAAISVTGLCPSAAMRGTGNAGSQT